MGKRQLGAPHLLGWVVMLTCGCDSTAPGFEPEGFGTSTTGSGGSGLFPEDCGFASGGGGGGFFGSGGSGAGSFLPQGDVIVPEQRPPAISGGTLLVGDDKQRAIIADPDRDLIAVVAVGNILERLYEIELEPGSEPGRLVEDAAGRVHVVLRGTGELVSVDLETGTLGDARSVCDNPRGLAYDKTADSLHVACAEGRLVTLPAGEGEATRSIEVADDLRDVVVRGDKLWVSTFRSAQVFEVSGDGEAVALAGPSGMIGPERPNCEDESSSESPEFEPTVAWRLTALDDERAILLHQRSLSTPLDLDSNSQNEGYGSRSCLGIVQSVVSIIDGGGASVAFPAIVPATLAVDAAVTPNGQWIALAVPGSERTVSLVNTLDVEGTSRSGDTPLQGEGEGCLFASNDLEVDGQATSVAFLSNQELLVLTRQPLRLYMFDQGTRDLIDQISLTGVDVTDAGHELFHHDMGRGIACASCHPEGRDDGHVWNFEDLGLRRTQELRGGLLGTEPFHWDGALAGFQNLVEEVMQRRMGGPPVSTTRSDALVTWIDAQPDLLRTGLDAEAIERGREIFESDEAECAVCHEGPMFTNNQNENVGTGQRLQVPALGGVSFRAPYMHDGCAETLEDRFSDCGGGDSHGKTSQLSENQLSDLIEYLRSL